MALLLKHQTPTEFMARFREAYRLSDREYTVQLATFLLAKIASVDFTDAQVRNAFNLTVQQWNILKGKMQDWVTAKNSIQTAAGE